MDPFVLTSRGTDMSKYMNFIYPPPFTLKCISETPRDRIHMRSVLPEPKTPCPRLLRSRRSDREMFALNPVIRVGGGYRRLSWKVLDVLPAIGQNDSYLLPEYNCMACHANMPVTERVTHSRGMLRTVVTVPKVCLKCGAHAAEYRTLSEKDWHESVLDTLHRGDAKFIIDHRRFDNAKKSHFSSAPGTENSNNSDEVDWRDDMECYRLHLSRQSQRPSDEDLDSRDHAIKHKRSESESSVFITDPGSDVNRRGKSPDVLRAWDNERSYIKGTEDYGSESGRWGTLNEMMNERYFSANDSSDDSTDFEVIENYDPRSGFTVRLRGRPNASAKTADRVIHGIHDDQVETGDSELLGKIPSFCEKERKNVAIDNRNQISEGLKERKTILNEEEKKHGARIKGKKHVAEEGRKFYMNENENNDSLLSDVETDEDNLRGSTFQGREPKRKSRKQRKARSASKHFYTVKLDQRDKVFDEEPVIPDEDFLFPPVSSSENPLSDDELSISLDDWVRGSPNINRGSRLSPSDLRIQDHKHYSSPLSTTPLRHDGYLADSEENADLRSLQAEIQKVRNDAKRYQKRKDEAQAMKRRKSRGNQARVSEDHATDSQERAPITQNSPFARGEWDSEWESDFSLHVKPLSDLSVSTSEDDLWRTKAERGAINSGLEEKSRKKSEVTLTKPSRRKESTSRSQDPAGVKGVLNEGAKDEQGKRYHTGEAQGQTRKTSRTHSIKPLPPVEPNPVTSTRRPRIRAPRGEDELSESDMNFFAQQLQAPYPKKDPAGSLREESPSGCKGMTCYRCASFIPECQGVCTMCGTMCQRPGGPCKACRDICESCSNPRYRCASAGKRPEGEDEDDDVEEEPYNTEDSDISGASQKQTAVLTAKEDFNEDQFNETERQVEKRLGNEHYEDTEQNIYRKKERKARIPPERKQKDTSKIRRVRGKRQSNNNSEINNNDSDAPDELGDRDLGENVHEEEPAEEQAPVEVPENQTRPSALPTRFTRKGKPSKLIISQKVIYNEKPRHSKTQITEHHSVSSNDDSAVTIPAAPEESANSGEPLSSDAAETGEQVQGIEGEVPTAQPPDDVKLNANSDVIIKVSAFEEPGKGLDSKAEEEAREEQEKKKPFPKVRGVMRVNAAFKERAELSKRLQNVLKEAVSDVIGQADMKVRRDSTIDYLAQYRLVDRSRVEMYGRAFTLEDEDEDGILSYKQMLLALEGVPSIAGMSRKQLLFVLQVLELGPGSRITFKLFAVLTALCEKITILDDFVKQLVEKLDLFDIECKLDFFKRMFFVAGDYSVTYITTDQLRIELKAGGLNQNQEDHVVGHILQSTQSGEISFLDYMAYLPLFISIHKNICDNALDMSRDKYRKQNRNT